MLPSDNKKKRLPQEPPSKKSLAQDSEPGNKVGEQKRPWTISKPCAVGASESIEASSLSYSRVGQQNRNNQRGTHADTGGCAQPRPPGLRVGRLDNTTKSASLSLHHDSDGVVLEHFDPTLKWQMQAVARLALHGQRIQVCMRHLRADRKLVQVRRSDQSGKTYYSGLMACGSVWCCPVCAPKIQAVRALEVRTAIDNWTAQGGSVVLLTQTVRHTRQDVLEPLLDRFTLALRKFKGCKGYTNARQRYGIEGSIRALEITDGANGWHPHAHTILFLQTPPPPLHLHADLFRLWESAARRAGFEGQLSPDAFDVQDASKVKNYVTKMGTEYQWNAEHELVKAHSKTGSVSSMTPFDMLRAYLDNPGDGRLLARFAEYALNFHGKRQLVWSDGLKKRLLGTDGLTDEQIAESIGELDPVLAEIAYPDWKLIRRYNLQGQVLRVVADFGRDGLSHFLAEYRV